MSGDPTPTTERHTGRPRLTLVCDRLHLRYGRTDALAGLDLRLDPGVSLGLVGRNGAGKSTLFRAIIGLEPLIGGRIHTEPETLSGLELASHIGYVPDHLSAHDWMTVDAAVDFTAQLRGGVDMGWRDELFERLSVPRTPKVRTLSRGMQARVAFLLGVIHRPDILLMDEPLLGVDAVSHDAILSMLARLRDETGCSIVIASHGLGDLAKITDRIAFIERGRIVEEIETDALIASTKRLVLRPIPDDFIAPPETVHVARRDEALVVTVRSFTRDLLDRLRAATPNGRIDVLDVTIAEACADRMRGMEMPT